MRVAALILAAGASRRMQGRDKLLEDVDAVPLLRRQTMRVLATGCRVWVALPAAPHLRYDALQGLPVTQVPVPDAAEGMNASLRAGISALPPQIDAVMIVLADMPELTTADFNLIIQAIDLKSETNVWRATSHSGSLGHPVVFHRRLFAQLAGLSGDAGARAVVAQQHAQTRLIALPADHACVDLDTPQEWDAWRKDR